MQDTEVGMEHILYYLLAINLLGLVVMGADKSKAARHKWRISENSIFFIALIGGASGVGLGMLVFHHKTKHFKFTVGIPVFIILNAVVLWYILGLKLIS